MLTNNVAIVLDAQATMLHSFSSSDSYIGGFKLPTGTTCNAMTNPQFVPQYSGQLGNIVHCVQCSDVMPCDVFHLAVCHMAVDNLVSINFAHSHIAA
jgi:hypothetical protein